MKRNWLIFIALFVVLLFLLCFAGCESGSNSASQSSSVDDDDDSTPVDDDDIYDDDDDDDSSSGPYDFSNLVATQTTDEKSVLRFDFDLDGNNRAGACYVATNSQFAYYLREKPDGQFTHELVSSAQVEYCAFFFDMENHPILAYSKLETPTTQRIVIRYGDDEGNWTDWQYTNDDYIVFDVKGGMNGNTPFFVTEGRDRYLITYSGGTWNMDKKDVSHKSIFDFSGKCGKIQGVSKNIVDPEQVVYNELQADKSWSEIFIDSYDYEIARLFFTTNSTCEPYALGFVSTSLVSDDDDDSDEDKGAGVQTLYLYSRNSSANWQVHELFENVAFSGDILVDDNGQIYIAFAHSDGQTPPSVSTKMIVGQPGNWQEFPLYDPPGASTIQLQMLPGTDGKLRVMALDWDDITHDSSLVYLHPASK